MTTIVLVPGLDNAGEDHWMTHLQATYSNVVRVEQTSWSAPDRESWQRGLEETLAKLEGELVLVGHSCGAITIAQWCEKHFDHRVKAILLVAPADVDSPSAVAEIHAMRPLPTAPIPCPSLVISSDNDPHIAPQQAQKMAQHWQSEYCYLPGCGHFVSETGFGEWPELRLILDELTGTRVLN